MAKKYPIKLLVDFDGVIHAYTSSWTRPDEIPDGPVPGAFDWIREMHADGVELVIYTARLRGTPLYRGDVCPPVEVIETALKAWFIEHGLEAEHLDKLTFERGKPHATLYIDDRAMCFRGRFPKVHQINAHRQWNKADSEDVLVHDVAAAVLAAQARGMPSSTTQLVTKSAAQSATGRVAFADPREALERAVTEAVKDARFQLDRGTVENIVESTLRKVLHAETPEQRVKP